MKGTLIRVAGFVVLIIMLASPVRAQEKTIPPGTTITMHNWQQYKDFMPIGMQAMFAGIYFWKMPADIQIEVGPTSNYPLNPAYVANTEKYADRVKIVDLPDGEHTLQGYVAGRPFPNPSGPRKGWEILVDEWYRYIPYEVCTSNVWWAYLNDRYNNMTSESGRESYRRMSHISEPGMPINLPDNGGIDYSEWVQVMSPEQTRYLTNLTIYYEDPTKPEDVFLFIPALRRSLRLSTAARCSPFIGTDLTQDDPRTGFNGGITRFDGTYLRDQPIVTLVNSDRKAFGVFANFYPPILWPRPAVGKWEVRDTWVVDIKRIPSQSKGYCYGKQEMWIDKVSGNLLWKDNYDSNLKLWKSACLIHIASPVPHVGMQLETGNFIELWYDQQNAHMTMATTSDPEGRWDLANEDCRNTNGIDYFDNIKEFNTVAGLSQVLR